MANFNNLFKRKEKSKEQIAREKLEHETGNSGFLVGTIFCGVALAWALLMLLAGNSVSTKITAGIISVLLVIVIIFLSLNYMKQKNAMTGILEAFLAGERSISNIAIGIGLNNKTTAKLIQTMMSKKIIIDANIDRTNNVIVDNKKTNCSPDNIGKIIICTGCGAKNTFTGKAGQRCEYCGAVISEEMINENR